MREPSLTIRPPMIEGSTLTSSWMSRPPEAALSWSLRAARLSLGERGGARDFGAGHAAARVVELAVVGDHLTQKEEPALDRDQPDEIGGDPGYPLFVEDRVERLDLVMGGEDRAADEALEVRASGDQGVELLQRLGHGVGLAVVLGEGEQGGRVAPGYARNDIGVFGQGPIIPSGRGIAP